MQNVPIPTWVQSVVEESRGHDIGFIMTKIIFMSDLDQHQNRLLIPKNYVINIQQMLSPEEMALANLNHGGLDIRVFTKNKFRVEEVKLRRWRSTDSTVIKGKGMSAFRAWSNLNVKDVVEMWGFRDGRDGKLCFAIGKV